MIPRQRLRSRRVPLVDPLVRLTAAAVALALIWYGAMTIILALKADPHTVNSISAYRTIYDHLANITSADITTHARLITAITGVLCFGIFSALFWLALPRAYLARHDLDLTGKTDRGNTSISPRAIERLAERAALAHPLVTTATGRYAPEDLTLNVTVRDAAALSDTLPAVQQRVATTVDDHQLPRPAINVTLAGIERSKPRELA